MKKLSIYVSCNNENFNELIFSNNSLTQDGNFRGICLDIIKNLFNNIPTITYCTNYNKYIVKESLFRKNERFVDFENKIYAKSQKIYQNTLTTYTKGCNEDLIYSLFLEKYPLQIPFSLYGYKNEINFEEISNLDDTDYFLYCSYEECHDNLVVFYDKKKNLEEIMGIIKEICAFEDISITNDRLLDLKNYFFIFN